MLRQNRVCIDMDAIRSNYCTLKENVPANVAVMPVVKANAYGHGMLETAQTLARLGADHFAVALPEEGIDLIVKEETDHGCRDAGDDGALGKAGRCPPSFRSLGQDRRTGSPSGGQSG